MQPDAPKIARQQWRSVAKTASYAVTGQDNRSVFQNLNSTVNITLTLPKALPELEYKFLVAVGHTITVTPKIATDTIRGRAAGASASNAVVGNVLWLVCAVPGFWEPLINIGAW